MMENKTTVINISNVSDTQLEQISKKNLLSLNLQEMKAVQAYFIKIRRNPTDIELETIAQTWSEHCKHKTLTASVTYTEIDGKKKTVKNYDNLIKETVFKVTKDLNKKWCVSVFKDNAGVIEFNDKYGIAFKVETHNHPSALEPYGGAGTGIGGVIRDILGVGLGSKPVMNTDIFCFGPIDYPHKNISGNVLHPRRIMKGVVSGVRDYGNRMGIPTTNGAVLFDEGYVFNPLVYCGTAGIIPKNKAFKKVSPGEVVLAVGGRTGRDGIHGATFSSIELDKDTEVSAVQIGNPIVEKKILDTILQARDKNLYTAITDCGAGGFSSAVGELGSECGVRVYLEKAPLKYAGLKPWEIWLSEAQERMVLSVPKNKLKELIKLFESENVEATVLGEFTNTGRLECYYKGTKICDLSMEFMHEGVPKRHLDATWIYKSVKPKAVVKSAGKDYAQTLNNLLAMPNVCSKEWIIRQYDHEVQGQTVIKPLQGKNAGPGDACVIWPRISIEAEYPKTDIKDKYRGFAVSCGINPNFGKIDAYAMAAGAIDEAVRNLVATGAGLEKTALLDNFCWGSPNKNEQLAGLIRASQACYDIAKVYETPFISGKDSLYNEYIDEKGKSKSIPMTLLISAMAIMNDVRKAVTMDLKYSGNSIYVLGSTKQELGGSQYSVLNKTNDYTVPGLDPQKAKKLYIALNNAMNKSLVAACHDCSEGGLAVSCAEMCFAGGIGMEIALNKVPAETKSLTAAEKNIILLFSESNSRFVVEIKKGKEKEFEKALKGNIFARIGSVTFGKNLIVKGVENQVIIDEETDNLKDAWQSTLKGL